MSSQVDEFYSALARDKEEAGEERFANFRPVLDAGGLFIERLESTALTILKDGTIVRPDRPNSPSTFDVDAGVSYACGIRGLGSKEEHFRTHRTAKDCIDTMARRKRRTFPLDIALLEARWERMARTYPNPIPLDKVTPLRLAMYDFMTAFGTSQCDLRITLLNNGKPGLSEKALAFCEDRRTARTMFKRICLAFDLVPNSDPFDGKCFIYQAHIGQVEPSARERLEARMRLNALASRKTRPSRPVA